MKRSVSAVLARVGSSLLAEWAIAADYGSFHVGPAETKEIAIGPAARELRVCNDFGAAERLPSPLEAMSRTCCRQGFARTISAIQSRQATRVAARRWQPGAELRSQWKRQAAI